MNGSEWPNPPKALVVNDDPFQLRLTSVLLEKEGFRTLPCKGVEEALRSAAEQGPVDVILTDLYMPGIDGWRFCRMLRSPEYAVFNKTPILVMSATFSGVDAEQVTADLGANAFLSVPYEPSTLRDCVRALLEGKAAQVQAKVLIVEDSPTQLKILRNAFESHGYPVWGAMTGAEASGLFQEHRPDLLILDYFLPDTTGDKLLEGFKKANASVVAVMTTVDQDPHRALDLIRKGADGYVRKPFDPKFLIDLCERIRRERSLLRIEEILEERTQKLRMSEERYRAIVEDQTEMICRFLPDGTLTFVNEATCRFFSKMAKELVGRPFLSFLSEKDHGRFEALMASLGPENPLGMLEYEGILPDEKSCWQQWTYRAIFNDRRKILEYQAVGRDISEFKQAEKEIGDLEEQLRQSQKMEAIGRLAGGIAHEFNNILTAVTGYSDLLLMNLDPGGHFYRYAREIKGAGDRAASLTQQLLAFSRKQILQPRVLNLNEVLDRMDPMLRRLTGEDVEFETYLAENLGSVKADQAQIEQVIFNLVVHAREAMPEGGKLVLETANVDIDEPYSRFHRGVLPGAYIGLTVSDTGRGEPPEAIEQIFEPFFTTQEKGKKTDLGLATSYGIIKQSGGSINVYSELGHGTTFRIYLPRMEEGAGPLPGQEETFPLEGGETILLVEDEESILEVAAQILREKGYRVLTAANGKDALHLAEGEPETIHLLLTDVIMPQMNGKELADRIQAVKPGIKVLFLSGYTDHAIVHQGVLDPGVDFLQKPFSLSTLLKKVKSVLVR